MADLSKLSMLKTYVISMPFSTERRAACMAHCAALGLEPEWFHGIDGNQLLAEYNAGKHQDTIQLSDRLTLKLAFGRTVSTMDRLSSGELGCAFSHLKVYEDMVSHHTECALILEDDVLLQEPLKAVLPEIMELDAYWDIVQIRHDSGMKCFPWNKRFILDKDAGVYLRREGMGRLDPIFNRRRCAWLAGAYLLNLKAAQRLLALAYPVRLRADFLLGFTAYNKLRLFCLHPQSSYVAMYEENSVIEKINGGNRPKHLMY